MVHQHFMLVDTTTVFENIILGNRNAKGIFINKEARRTEILELSERYAWMGTAVGAQQRVELFKAPYRGTELLVLDEPSAALTDIEVEGLFDIMHKMREVLRISRITILRSGETVCPLDRDAVNGEALAHLMIARELASFHYEEVEHPGDPVVDLTNVDYHKASEHSGLNSVSLTVGRWEIVGTAGVDGHGTLLKKKAIRDYAPQMQEKYDIHCASIE